MEIGPQSIGRAAARIAPYVRRTPVLEVDSRDFGLKCRLLFKLEMLQLTGTFKIRGAYNLLLSQSEAPTEVVAASGGNFALAIGHAATSLGLKVHLFVPGTSPAAKIDRVRATGADVSIIEGFYGDALEASREHVAQNGGLFAHAYDQTEVVEGAGTCGLEILSDVPDVDTVLVAVGGGGLIGGIAAAIEGRSTVIGIETELTPTFHAARASGKPVDVEVGGLAVSSLGSKRFGDIAWEIQKKWIAESLLVTDDAVLDAQRRLWANLRIMVEPGAAVGMAALLSAVYRPRSDETLVVVLSGANLDPSSIL